MNTREIDGGIFGRMLVGGAASLAAHTEELNALNVFPVADGDTGTNMLKTMNGGIEALPGGQCELGKASEAFSRGALLGARGNSGVILSQIFAGINQTLSKLDKVDAAALSEAYGQGVERSYAAVQNPTEGTILTVFRESTEYAAANIGADSTVEEFFELHLKQARLSLADTKQKLRVLAECDVVDSGAAGYLYIAEGMYDALMGREIKYTASGSGEKRVNVDLFTRDSVLEFGYCTEFLLRLMTAKVDPDNFDTEIITHRLSQLGTESVVAFKTEDVVKVHVHTHRPGEVLSAMQEYGEFLTVKIENMSLGHSDDAPKPKNRIAKDYSVVAVASGDGLCSLFSELGADEIVSGGQTQTPSTEEFISAFSKFESKDIIVLPNNKNVILAARQAAEVYKDARVHIIPTKSIMEGYAALSVITPGIEDVEMLVKNASRAAEGVVGCEITRAVRCATVDGVRINEGEYMAISGGRISATADSASGAVMGALSGIDMDDYEIITLFVGEGVSEEERAALTERIEEEYPDCETEVYIGNQAVYDYLVAVE